MSKCFGVWVEFIEPSVVCSNPNVIFRIDKNTVGLVVANAILIIGVIGEPFESICSWIESV
jgi:hypothetical protein